MVGGHREVTSRYEGERAVVVGRRLRIMVAVLTVMWILQLGFGDAEFFDQFYTFVLVYRVPQFAANGAMLLWLRKPRALAAIERAIIAWAVVVLASAACALPLARPDFAPLFMASYLLGLLGIVPAMGLRWPAMATFFGLSVVAFLPSGIYAFDDHRALVLAALAIIAVPYTAIVAGTAVRDRAQRAEHLARAELADALARLRAEEQARTRLFINLSHDLRTPLAIVKGETELLQQQSRSAGEAAALQRIATNTESVVELTDQLLELARLDARRLPHQPTVVDLAALARDVAAQLAPRPGGGRIEVVAPEPIGIQADPSHLRRILTNVIVNGIREVRRNDGVVTVTISRDGALAVVDVADDGDGIPADRRDAIFERFMSFDVTGSTASGIGLPLARELAELNAGTLVLLDGETRTTFRISFPAVDADVPGASPPRTARPEPPVNAPHAHGQASERMPVLVVEDNPEMADLLCRFLGTHHPLQLATTVAEARACIARRTPRAILCDIMLPDGSGYEVLGEVRADRPSEHIPVIFVSALSEPSEQARGLHAGADDYVRKPVSADELRARVDAAIARGEARAFALAAQREAFVAELHDGACASLTRAALLLSSTTHAPEVAVKRALETIREGLADARSVMAVLDGKQRPWHEVASEIRFELDGACGRAGINSVMHVESPEPSPLLTAGEALTVRRAVREAVTNALKHSGTSRISVVARVEAARLSVRIDDGGPGMHDARAAGRGLEILVRRVEQLGGTARFGTRPEGGAYVELTIPLSSEPSLAVRKIGCPQASPMVMGAQFRAETVS